MSIGRKVFSFATVLLAFAALSTFTFAQETPETKSDSGDKTRAEGRKGRMGHKGRSGFRGGRGHHKMISGLHKLNLTESQSSQIKTMMETHKIGQQPLHEEMKALHMKMREGGATEGDRARIEELRTQSRDAFDQVKNSILAILTPEQLQQLETMKAERKQRMEERRQRWMERRQQQKPAEPTKTDN